jgi:hypothetical protein
LPCRWTSALYQQFKSRQLKAAHAALIGAQEPAVRFAEHLYRPFYGGRRFSVQDPMDGN